MFPDGYCDNNNKPWSYDDVLPVGMFTAATEERLPTWTQPVLEVEWWIKYCEAACVTRERTDAMLASMSD